MNSQRIWKERPILYLDINSFDFSKQHFFGTSKQFMTPQTRFSCKNLWFFLLKTPCKDHQLPNQQNGYRVATAPGGATVPRSPCETAACAATSSCNGKGSPPAAAGACEGGGPKGKEGGGEVKVWPPGPPEKMGNKWITRVKLTKSSYRKYNSTSNCYCAWRMIPGRR